ncbi:hypothetical protein CGZ88_0374 [Bifidobacterium anseris]|uniref:Uncharacterized protein n=1 Tax=Bifidobacterium anseris TaxID=2020963 RepID=A0A2N5J1X0_9BIFI|nr:hypothetical protein [Bifidobacterium anseris]PLS28212.1 hypothetical protein CGZ88_0374 [Bifidobacterium anseris]
MNNHIMDTITNKGTIADEALDILEYGLLVEALRGYRPKGDYPADPDNEAAQQEARFVNQLVTKGFGGFDPYGGFIPNEYAAQWLEEHRGRGAYSLEANPVDEPEEWWDSPEYVIAAPFWLTDQIESVRPLSNREVTDFAAYNKEPYVGYTIEFTCWDDGWRWMSDMEAYALDAHVTELPWVPDPLEYYVARAKFSHEREWDAIEAQMAATLGVPLEELCDLPDKKYHTLFWNIADERRRINPPRCIQDDPLTYPYLQTEGYIEDLGEDGFRFLRRTRNLGLIQGQEPYVEACERAEHDVDERLRRIAQEEGN